MFKEEKVLNNEEGRIKTSITKIEPNKIFTRGYSQDDLIANISFSKMVYLLLKGELPSEKESKMFNHALISFCDHGVTPPSTQTSRLIASSGSPLNVALSGGLLSFGKKHAGAIEDSMKLFQEIIDNNKSKFSSISYNFDINDFSINNANINDIINNTPNEDNISNDLNIIINELAKMIVKEYLDNNRKIPGFGHRYHKKDPRGAKLMSLAKEKNFLGVHIKLALAIEKELFDKKGICINVDGANAAILSDMGFSSTLGFGIFMIGRIPGIIAHINEEVNEEEEFRKFCDIEDVSFHGNVDKSINTD
ncbi:Citrate synthase [Candidatus Methanobinarius endosymbioticus]|uniref:Citrate synthase n=1 Tax=Candidatus Methanobinarius endosymbioticus TaxID=2006182 RepID=A0A366MDD4_9EURY|nr:Citrate synthase [Candidatus Methanobinarius endosymbioticus]